MNSTPSAPLKKKLRSEFQKKLDHLSFSDLILKSERLSASFQKNIVQQADFPAFLGKFIVSFYPFGNEPQINIESEKNDEPYQVSYVRITDWGNREMVASRARRDQPGQWEEIAVSPRNKIFQPTSIQSICTKEEVAAILVPALAFTPNGERLGRGAGFYDRFLNLHSNALRIGIAFEDQLIDALPTDPWDEKVDVILTDHGIREVLDTKLLGEWKSRGKIRTRSI